VKRPRILNLAGDHASSLIATARDASQVTGLTHNFYRYPARFSPRFVRAAIEAFTKRGDVVLDPFMGGGTTLVEAAALGRNAIGADISSLAAFVSSVKTTCYTDAELKAVGRWAMSARSSVHMHRSSGGLGSELTRHKNLDGPTTWRLRKAISQALATTRHLRSPAVQNLARCVVLKTAQSALDGRGKPATVEQFRTALIRSATEMTEGAREFQSRVAETANASVNCLHRTSVGLESDPALRTLPTPRLVLTSPPYPGIHVLYHRWQVGGGRETAAPFWIANRLDGSGASYYTMGSRAVKGLESYFDTLRASLKSVAALCNPETVVVQVVAFSDPSRQLAAYLSVAEESGLAEETLADLRGVGDGRLWRVVPNRKWYAMRKGRTHSSNEVVLFHRLRS
jgi:hypothetical protein